MKMPTTAIIKVNAFNCSKLKIIKLETVRVIINVTINIFLKFLKRFPFSKNLSIPKTLVPEKITYIDVVSNQENAAIIVRTSTVSLLKLTPLNTTKIGALYSKRIYVRDIVTTIASIIAAVLKNFIIIKLYQIKKEKINELKRYEEAQDEEV